MGQKDLAQNDYFDDKARFADVCNGILFGGENRIRPEELSEAAGELIYRERQGKLRKLIPDKVRTWKGICIALIAVESQSMVDYSMVLRNMKTEAVSYEKQWRERERQRRRDGSISKKGYLCWKDTKEKFLPVVTIVVYLGTEKAWDGSRCLYDMLDISKELEPYVTNYKLNLFDYHSCKDFSIFQTENRELFEVLSCANDEKKMNELMHGAAHRYGRLDRDTASLICNMAGLAEESIMITEEEGEGGTDMWKAWDDHIERGRREGRAEGISVGRREGREEGISVGKQESHREAIRKMMDKLKLTAAQAMEVLDIAEEEREQYL